MYWSYFALINHFLLGFLLWWKGAGLWSHIFSLLAFTNPVLIPLSLRENSICSSWYAVWTKQHGENSSNSTLSFSKYWPKKKKKVSVISACLKHSNYPKAKWFLHCYGSQNQHRSIFEQDNCLVPLFVTSPLLEILHLANLVDFGEVCPPKFSFNKQWVCISCVCHTFNFTKLIQLLESIPTNF